MATSTPTVPYLTQQWSGLTHYVCPLCGYNTFLPDVLDAHRCQPPPEPESPAAPAQTPPAPAPEGP